MKVLVLATDEQKQELLSCPMQEGLDLLWVPQMRDGLLPADIGIDANIDACIDLLFENDIKRIEWLSQLSSLVVINSVINTLEETSVGFVRINGWNSFIQRPVIEAAAKGEPLKRKAEQLFQSLGRKTEWVPDVPGFITPRIVAAIINEAFLALEEEVSAEREIDTAMKLGTNYPYGPFEWGKKIGLGEVYSLLESLNKEQMRYKPSRLLKEKILV